MKGACKQSFKCSEISEPRAGTWLVTSFRFAALNEAGAVLHYIKLLWKMRQSVSVASQHDMNFLPWRWRWLRERYTIETKKVQRRSSITFLNRSWSDIEWQTVPHPGGDDRKRSDPRSGKAHPQNNQLWRRRWPLAAIIMRGRLRHMGTSRMAVVGRRCYGQLEAFWSPKPMKLTEKGRYSVPFCAHQKSVSTRVVISFLGELCKSSG